MEYICAVCSAYFITEQFQDHHANTTTEEINKNNRDRNVDFLRRKWHLFLRKLLKGHTYVIAKNGTYITKSVQLQHFHTSSWSNSNTSGTLLRWSPGHTGLIPARHRVVRLGKSGGHSSEDDHSLAFVCVFNGLATARRTSFGMRCSIYDNVATISVNWVTGNRGKQHFAVIFSPYLF